MRKRITLALLSMLLVPLAMMAQNVTVSPSSGNLMATVTDEGETGFQIGLCAVWRHEQLDLTVTATDRDNINEESGQISMPSAVLGKRYYKEGSVVVDSALTIVGGHRPSFFTVSLPNGYRITGYRIVLVNDLFGDVIPSYVDKTKMSQTDRNGFENLNSGNSTSSGTATMRFYETKPWTTGGTNSTSTYNSTNVRRIEPNQIGAEIIKRAEAEEDEDYNINPSDVGKEFIIKRTAIHNEDDDTWDMGNILYFRLVKNYYYYGITIKSFEIYFTAEGDFGADVKPESAGQARSVVRSPFYTSKTDFGAMGPKTKDGQTYFAYDYRHVRDLVGYTYLYQTNAVQNGVPAEGTEEKHIYPVEVGGQNLYALCNDTYYIEPPISVFTPSGWESPVGYRVVGATFNYVAGTQTPGHQVDKEGLYISFESGGTTYYLNDLLHFSPVPFPWSYDPSTNAVYTGTGINTKYLACFGTGSTRTLTFSSENASSDRTNPGYYDLIRFTENGKNYIGWSSGSYYLIGTTNPGATPEIKQGVTENAATWNIENHPEQIPDFKPGSYKLTIYDKDGETLATPVISVGASSTGSFHLTGLNNDAVKFEISDLSTGTQALLSITLEMQALNPYIDKMDIVCHDPSDQNGLKLTQTFTADDFTVSGGEFKFNIPQSYKDKLLTFTFSDLYSKYGDETYYTGTSLQKNGTARYSFVTSSYFVPIDQNDDNGLYDDAYDPDASYVNKVKTSTAGEDRFKFNNAEDLSPTSGGTQVGYYEDYPFTVPEYLDKGGGFIDCQLQASSTTNNSDTYYVFTADETRYNIAPTHNWQHRSYAFYRMDIALVAETYHADLTWDPIYEHSCLVENKKDIDKPMWGLNVATTLEGGGSVKGYLTVKEIDDAITTALSSSGADHPTSADQILYVDASPLYSILTSQELTLEQLKAKLAKNALFYLPEGSTSTLDNFAYLESGAYRAGKDIVLTDMQPLYVPYDIQVDAANHVEYKRLITRDNYGKVQNASLILPFGVVLNNEGKHTNADGSSFSLHTMKTTDALSVDANNKEMVAFFPAVNDVTISAPNTPYLVKVDENHNSNAEGVTFTVSQTGGTVSKTPTKDLAIASAITSTGTAVGGEGAGKWKFTMMGTYAGQRVPKDDNIFYFASNHFVNSKDYKYDAPIIVTPFRAYFATEASANAKLSSFGIIFEEGEGNETDAIGALSAVLDVNAPVYDLQGRMVAVSYREAKSLQRGMYVVNGVKIIVK